MLKIFNDLRPFFEDCQHELCVREYARSRGVSAPTASALLEKFARQGLLERRVERRHHLYRTNINSRLFVDLSRIYWGQVLEKSGLIAQIKKDFAEPTIILFGACAEAEVHPDSDIDIAIFSTTATEKTPTYRRFAAKLSRELDIFPYKQQKDVSKHLRYNILRGYRLSGEWIHEVEGLPKTRRQKKTQPTPHTRTHQTERQQIVRKRPAATPRNDSSRKNRTVIRRNA